MAVHRLGLAGVADRPQRQHHHQSLQHRRHARLGHRQPRPRHDLRLRRPAARQVDHRPDRADLRRLRLIEFTDRAGDQTKITSSPAYPYEPTAVTDSRGGVYKFEYDGNHRLTKFTKPTAYGLGT